jgi:hypothetical protein
MESFHPMHLSSCLLLQEYVMSSRRDGLEFAAEVKCSDYTDIDFPMALHAAWYYFPPNEVNHVIEQALKNMAALAPP